MTVLLVSQADVTHQTQCCFFSEEQHGSLLRGGSAREPGRVLSFLLGRPPSLRSPEPRAPTLPPLPGQALGPRGQACHGRAQTLVCGIHHVHLPTGQLIAVPYHTGPATARPPPEMGPLPPEGSWALLRSRSLHL